MKPYTQQILNCMQCACYKLFVGSSYGITGNRRLTTIQVANFWSYNSIEKRDLKPVLALRTVTSPQSHDPNSGGLSVRGLCGCHLLASQMASSNKQNQWGKLGWLNNHMIHLTSTVICLTTLAKKRVIKLGVAHLTILLSKGSSCPTCGHKLRPIDSVLLQRDSTKYFMWEIKTRQSWQSGNSFIFSGMPSFFQIFL